MMKYVYSNRNNNTLMSNWYVTKTIAMTKVQKYLISYYVYHPMQMHSPILSNASTTKNMFTIRNCNIKRTDTRTTKITLFYPNQKLLSILFALQLLLRQRILNLYIDGNI